MSLKNTAAGAPKGTGGQNAAEQLRSQLSRLNMELDALQKSARLASIKDELEDLDGKLAKFPARIAELRSRGYVFDQTLESRVQGLSQRWREIRQKAESEAARQSSPLMAELPQVQSAFAQVSSLASTPEAALAQLPAVKTRVEGLKSAAAAAEKTVRGLYDAFAGEVWQIGKEVDRVERMITLLAQATFRLTPAEAGLAAVKAYWVRSGKKDKTDPEGVAFLTDQRLLFEQREEIATKKVLFIATEREKVQKLLWEVPLALVEKTVASKQGILKNQDFLELQLASGAPFPEITLHLDGMDSSEWAALINRARSGELDQNRAVPVDAAALEKARSAPTQCPSCGGAITRPVLRGQDSITCDFCGVVIRL